MIPTPADLIINDLIAGITNIKADLIIGVYLTGSIPLNDFHPNKSDVDFLVLCKEPPTTKQKLLIEQLHKIIERKFRNPTLNGCYITPDCLDVHNTQSAKVLCFHEGHLNESAFEMAPIVLFELKKQAFTIVGIPAQDLPINIEFSDVCRFLSENINTYWRSWIFAHSSLIRRQLLLILVPRLTEWVILGVARQLYTLQTGRITSKTNAGYYSLEHLPCKFHPVIKKAIEIRRDEVNHVISIRNSYYLKPSLKRCLATIKCAEYIIDLFNKEYTKRKM